MIVTMTMGMSMSIILSIV